MAAQDITVVIPAYRAAATIGRTLDSCLRSLHPEQIIAVLDGPDPDMEEAIHAASPDIPVHVLPAGSGAPACRNFGLGQARTKYVMFLDADDYVEGEFLASVLHTAESAGADVVFGAFCMENPDGSRKWLSNVQRYNPLEPATIMKRWLVGGYTPPCGMIWRSGFVRDIGGWDEALAKNQDGDLVYRALMAKAVLAACEGGNGVYVLDDNPHRITRQQNAHTLASQAAVLDKIRVRLHELPFDPRPELALAYYGLARLAYLIWHDAIGADAEARARALGLKGQPGSFLHKLVAIPLGLRRKQRFGRFAHRLVNPLRGCLGRIRKSAPVAAAAAPLPVRAPAANAPSPAV